MNACWKLEPERCLTQLPSHWNNSKFEAVCCHTQALDRVSQFRSIRQAIMTGIAAPSLPDLQTQFTGELQVKLILTGLAPNIADLAKLPPIWATGGSRSVFCKLQHSASCIVPIWEWFWILQTSCTTQHWHYVRALLNFETSNSIQTSSLHWTSMSGNSKNVFSRCGDVLEQFLLWTSWLAILLVFKGFSSSSSSQRLGFPTADPELFGNLVGSSSVVVK